MIEPPGNDSYPVTDLVICPASFLNADANYVHKNQSFRGFGSYGDVLVRDRKMYVVPTPFALTENTTGLATLIVPAGYQPESNGLVHVGDLARIEAAEVVCSYTFDLETNELRTITKANPHAGRVHLFKAFRSQGHSTHKHVTMTGATHQDGAL